MIQRYVFKEVAVPMLAWLALLLVLMWAMAVLRGNEVLLGSQGTFRDFLQVSGYLLPHLLVQATPVAFLLGLFIGLGRLSSDREFLAMQSFGLRPERLFWSPMLLAVLTSAMLMGLALGPQTWGLKAAQRWVYEIIKRNLVGDVKPGVFHSELPKVTLYVEKVDAPGAWENVFIYDERMAGAPVLMLAKQGGVSHSAPGEPLQVHLKQGSLYRAVGDDDARVQFETATLNLGLDETVWHKNRIRSVRDEMTPQQMLAQASHEPEASARSLKVAANWKFGQVLMPISFAFLGVPLGLRRRTSGRALGVLMSLMGYALFYVLAQVGTSLGERAILPAAIAGQIPNLFFISLGLLALLTLRRPA